jgi:sporulation protein YlmC with PRC-barrel domain
MKRMKRGSLFIVWLLILALFAAACDGDSDNDGVDDSVDTGDVVTTIDPLATEEIADVDVTPIITDDEEMEEPTAVIEDTPVIEMTETPMMEETEEPTATVEVMATEEMTPTEEAVPTVEATVEMITDTDTMTSTITHAILASDLVGMDITNQDGEEVGEVAELLVDSAGMVQYVIFDVGGFLGIDAKSVAVAWDEMTIHLEDDVELGDDEEFDVDDLTVMYTALAPDLEALPEFDTSILDDNGYIMDEDADPEDDFDAAPYVGMLEVDEFQDYDLRNTEDEDLGEVEDLVIDLNEGQVSYAVVDFGGFLGIAENSVAVPWSEFQLNGTDDPDEEIFTLDVAEADLEAAPTFDFGEWTYPTDLDWDIESRQYWEAS